MALRLSLCLLLVLFPWQGSLPAQVRIRDLAAHDGDTPVRLVGFGLVVGLDGSGDRSFGTSSGSVQTVRTVVNLLKRFNIEIPAERLRLRNVAAVLVTAEVSPWLRPGGRFDLQVASLGDATSLRGGVLWMTPMMTDQDQPVLATAQGPLAISGDMDRRLMARGGSSGRILDGGLLEVALPVPAASPSPRLILHKPDLTVAARIQSLIDSVYGAGTAKIEDPGSLRLIPPASATDSMIFLAAVDTLPVEITMEARIVIDGRTGMVVVGGEVPIRPASVSVKGITLRVGRAGTVDSSGTVVDGTISLPSGALVSDVVAGLHAAKVSPSDIAALFEGLRASNAITARVIVR